MITKDHLEIVADITAILTFVGAVGAWGHYQCGLVQKRKTLEKCLKDRGESFKKNHEPGEFNFMYIITYTGLTEAEIIQASFKSKRIGRRETKDKDGYATGILFRYIDRP